MGHLGGANNKSKEISDILNSIPVITTTTDISGKIANRYFGRKIKL